MASSQISAWKQQEARFFAQYYVQNFVTLDAVQQKGRLSSSNELPIIRAELTGLEEHMSEIFHTLLLST